MSHPSPARRLLPVLLPVFASLTLFLAFATPARSAGPETTGKAVFTLGTGKAGKALKKQNVKLVRIGAAKVKRLARKRFRAVLPARSVLMKPARVMLNGGVKFKRGGRVLPVRNLRVKAKGRSVVVTGKAAGRNLRIFAGKGKVVTASGKGVRRINIKRMKLKLANPAAKLLRKKLKLRKRVPAAPTGSLKVNAQTTQGGGPAKDLDPYFAQCGISGTHKVAGEMPEPAALPDMTGAKPLTGTPAISWGFKASFRGYLEMFGGSLHAADGAGRESADPGSNFTFPVKGGSYKANDPVNTADDQAVINGKGTAVFCNPAHGFRIAVSNPTIVVDGEHSRIVADVDTNYFGAWSPAQRVDLADLDLEGITPFYNRSGSTVDWGAIPGKLTESGAEAFCVPPNDDFPAQCLYQEDDPVDPIPTRADTAYPVGNGSPGAWETLATFTKTELPFPLGDPAAGGCAIPDFPGGTPQTARTIDEYLALNAAAENPADPPQSEWTATPSRPAASPDLTGGTDVTGGGLAWGALRGLRSSASGTGEFNLAGGATASDTPYYGHGPGATSDLPRPGYNQKMGAPNAFFTWPADSTAGTYKASGGDRKLTLRTKGRVSICNDSVTPPFLIGYGTVISNPTVVIDGAESRITADVATRYRLSWVRGTVDVARFDAADATVTENTSGSTTTVSWKLPLLSQDPGPPPAYLGSKTGMTAAGSAVLRMLAKDYLNGYAMDNPTVTASFPAGP